MPKVSSLVFPTSQIKTYRLSKLFVNMNKYLCCEKLFFNEFSQESKGGSYSYRVCIYESLFSYCWQDIFHYYHQGASSKQRAKVGEKPLEIGFKKPEPLPDNTKAGPCTTELTLRDLPNYDGTDWRLKTHTFPTLLSVICLYELLPKEMALLVICENCWGNSYYSSETEQNSTAITQGRV